MVTSPSWGSLAQSARTGNWDADRARAARTQGLADVSPVWRAPGRQPRRARSDRAAPVPETYATWLNLSALCRRALRRAALVPARAISQPDLRLPARRAGAATCWNAASAGIWCVGVSKPLTCGDALAPVVVGARVAPVLRHSM